jgi:FtsZ family protein
MSLYEVNEVASLIHEEAHEGTNIIFGAVIDEKVEDEIQVTVIATGFGEQDAEVRTAPRTTVHSPSATPNTSPVQAMRTRLIEPTQAERSSSSLRAADSVQPTPANKFDGKPVRRSGMIVGESTLDFPAFKRRSSEAETMALNDSDAIETDDEPDIQRSCARKVTEQMRAA